MFNMLMCLETQHSDQSGQSALNTFSLTARRRPEEEAEVST